MSNSDWAKCVYYANKYGTYPELLAAIGWHETHWGRLGWGRYGFYLGVGCYSETEANWYFAGLDRQLDWAAKRLGKYLGRNVTLAALTGFAREVWRPGNPDAWARSVYKIYLQLGGAPGKEGENPFLGRIADSNISSELELKAITRTFQEMADMLKRWVAYKRV
jgi:hypothetical protein